MSPTPPIDLPVWALNLLPGHLFWSYDCSEKRVTFLPRQAKNAYTELIPMVLTDLRFAASVVADEDFPRFKYFINHLRQGTADQVVVRLINQLGQWRHIKLATANLSVSPPLLSGLFLDLTDLLNERELTRTLANKEEAHRLEIQTPSAPTTNESAPAQSLPSLLKELCLEQGQAEQRLFDAIATLSLESEGEKRWVSYGFVDDPPSEAELDHFRTHLKENLDQQSLAPLIVNHTLTSHQALDWALFVRSGLLSYWIQPLISRRKVKGVLVFASREAWRYHPDQYPQLSRVVERVTQQLLSRPSVQSSPSGIPHPIAENAPGS